MSWHEKVENTTINVTKCVVLSFSCGSICTFMFIDASQAKRRKFKNSALKLMLILTFSVSAFYIWCYEDGLRDTIYKSQTLSLGLVRAQEQTRVLLSIVLPFASLRLIPYSWNSIHILLSILSTSFPTSPDAALPLSSLSEHFVLFLRTNSYP